MSKKYSMEPGTDPHQVVQLLEDRIYEHNSTTINKDDGRLFSRIVRNEHKDIIAGIAGWTWAGACEITQLWVDKNVRNNGIGKTLLEAAEEEAKSRGCLIVLVKSYSFQAPHFYERYGYTIEHTLHGFPEGHGYHTLSKRIG